jgi:hypothetical protein
MALTAKQRAKLPPSAFVYPSTRKYPVPTKAQAQKAGISEKQRIATHRAAKSYAARKDTAGSPAKVNAVVHKRGPLKPSGKRKR